MKTPYFTVSKAQRLITHNVKLLSDSLLQIMIVKLRDYDRYMAAPDIYGNYLVEGGYYKQVIHPDASGFAPADAFLQSNTRYVLDEAIREKMSRAVTKATK